MSLLVSVNESVSMTPSRPTSRLPRACVARFKHFDKQTVAVCPCLFFSFFLPLLLLPFGCLSVAQYIHCCSCSKSSREFVLQILSQDPTDFSARQWTKAICISLLLSKAQLNQNKQNNKNCKYAHFYLLYKLRSHIFVSCSQGFYVLVAEDFVLTILKYWLK